MKSRGCKQVDLARALGVSEPTVSRWMRRGAIPPERVLAVEAATGISRHVLRPDIYPLPASTEAA